MNCLFINWEQYVVCRQQLFSYEYGRQVRYLQLTMHVTLFKKALPQKSYGFEDTWKYEFSYFQTAPYSKQIIAFLRENCSFSYTYTHFSFIRQVEHYAERGLFPSQANWLREIQLFSIREARKSASYSFFFSHWHNTNYIYALAVIEKSHENLPLNQK